VPQSRHEFLQQPEEDRATPQLAKLAALRSGTLHHFVNYIRDRVRRLLVHIRAGAEQSSSTTDQGNAVVERRLESGTNFNSSPVLPDNSDFLRTGRRSVGSEEEATNRWGAGGKPESVCGRGSLMPVALIKPNSHLKIKYPVPRGRRIEYEVESDKPVTTYVLDEEGLDQFYNGRAEYITSYYGGFSGRRKHYQQLKLPFKGDWYLVIKNDQDKAVAVHYEVSSPGGRD
jgi:hypothetical protein